MRARIGVVLLRAARIVTGSSNVSASTAAPAAVLQMEPISFWRIGNTRLLLTHVVWPRLATSRAAILLRKVEEKRGEQGVGINF